MIRVHELRLPVDHTDADLLGAVRDRLNSPDLQADDFVIFQRAVDARRGRAALFSYTVDVRLPNPETFLADEAKARGRRITRRPDGAYRFLEGKRFRPGARRPVVIGTGPAGLFAGLLLGQMGLAPLLLERGKPAGERARDVTKFWRTGEGFDPESNVQFGEGGAGTFSDGKLYTRIGDEGNRCRGVLETLAAHGAPEEILVDSRPHVGTDRLITVLRRLRATIQGLGGEFRFQTRVDDLHVEAGRLRGVVLADGTEIETDEAVLAVGHSARDVFRVLERRGVAMIAKPFSIGARIEHPQRLIDKVRHGASAGHPRLGSASYKFVHHAGDGRGVYSFCMCPGGLVVASSSEAGGVVTNGMSGFARDEANANAGFMVEARPSDFPGRDPLAGLRFQRALEERAFQAGGGDYRAPAQLLGDFLAGRPSRELGDVRPSYRPGVVLGDLRDVLPEFVVRALREAARAIARGLPGFDRPDAVLTAVESRSSSPLRIVRGEDFQSVSVTGLYPAGEGAGYAGGIVSAAVDGLRVAEALGLKCLA